MRLFLSLLFTFFGLAAVYLFASGALSELSWSSEGVEFAVDRALRPFSRADIVSTLILTIGMASFASGVLVAPRSDVWVAFGSRAESSSVEGQVLRYSREVSRERVLELALLFNVLVVGAILVLAGMAVARPVPPRLLGALFAAGVLEVLLGLGIMTYLLVSGRKRRTKRFRPLLAAAAGANILEIVFMVAILVFGFTE